VSLRANSHGPFPARKQPVGGRAGSPMFAHLGDHCALDGGNRCRRPRTREWSIWPAELHGGLFTTLSAASCRSLRPTSVDPVKRHPAPVIVQHRGYHRGAGATNELTTPAGRRLLRGEGTGRGIVRRAGGRVEHTGNRPAERRSDLARRQWRRGNSTASPAPRPRPAVLQPKTRAPGRRSGAREFADSRSMPGDGRKDLGRGEGALGSGAVISVEAAPRSERL